MRLAEMPEGHRSAVTLRALPSQMQLFLKAYFLFRRRSEAPPSPTRPSAINDIVIGSGVTDCGVPTMFSSSIESLKSES